MASEQARRTDDKAEALPSLGYFLNPATESLGDVSPGPPCLPTWLLASWGERGRPAVLRHHMAPPQLRAGPPRPRGAVPGSGAPLSSWSESNFSWGCKDAADTGAPQKGNRACLLGSATPGFKSQLPSWLTSGTAISGQVFPSQPQGRRHGAHPRGHGGPGAPGQRTKSWLTPAPRGSPRSSRPGLRVSTRDILAPPFSPARPPPRTEAWSPAHLASLARDPDGKTAGGPTWWVPASTGKDSRTSSSREPQGGAHRPPKSRETTQTQE